MPELKRRLTLHRNSLKKIRQEIIDMTTVGINGHSAIPQTTAELTELAAAGGQLGISQENIIDFTEVMAQMGTATNLVGEEGAATLARFQNVMGVGQNEIRNIGSAIVDLGNHSATTESEIAAMALRMGKYGSSVRMSAADVLGYSAALSSLGIEAQMGGSAIGRTWLSIHRNSRCKRRRGFDEIRKSTAVRVRKNLKSSGILTAPVHLTDY